MKEIRQYDKRVGVTYVYAAESYYDKESHRTRMKRTLIGKVGEDGEVIPTGKVGRPKKTQAPVTKEDESVTKLFEAAKIENAELRAKLKSSEHALQLANAEIEKLREIIDQAGKLLKQV